MTSFLDTLINFLASLFGGKKTEEQPAEKPAEAPKPEPKMLMHEDVFRVMTTSETEEMREKLRKEMAEKDQLGLDTYTVCSNEWEYTISRPKSGGRDMTDQYGTQFSANRKHA